MPRRCHRTSQAVGASGDVTPAGRVGLTVYLGAAVWLATSLAPADLISDYTIMVEEAAWGPAILAGRLGATF